MEKKEENKLEEKRKIINDPVFGFITIPSRFLLQLIEHPYVQRLQRIKQMGLASFVYPGAQHTRLNHSIGAMYLMGEALKVLQEKGHQISPKEVESALAAILLHDIGHTPFSHVLERTIVPQLSHEEVSLMLMHKLNEEFDNKLDTCLEIFTDTYHKRFLHQLVSGQLDVDRLDYLRRDSFFSGVIEGNIGSARIIKMLELRDDRLVVESKGIYSIENFLLSRRLMYWQVYLHKTAVAAELMLTNILQRAKELCQQGHNLPATPSLTFFLQAERTRDEFASSSIPLNHFVNLDDSDIWCALKAWTQHDDVVLSTLSRSIIDRKLFKIEMSEEPTSPQRIEELRERIADGLKIEYSHTRYFVHSSVISTNMYSAKDDSIDILFSDGTIKDIAKASDMLNIHLLSKKVEKNYLAYLRH